MGKANEVRDIRQAKGCSMGEAISHVNNRKLKKKLRTPCPKDERPLDHQVKMMQQVMDRLIDISYPVLPSIYGEAE